MRSTRRFWNWITFLGIVIMSFPLYAAAYYATLSTQYMSRPSGGISFYPTYRIRIRGVVRIPLPPALFAPMHYLDRHLRPDRWRSMGNVK